MKKALFLIYIFYFILSYVACKSTKNKILKKITNSNFFYDEQVYVYGKLSENYVYIVKYIKLSDTNNYYKIKIRIYDKNRQKNTDMVSFKSYYFIDILGFCEEVRSYITNFNTKKEVVDNFYGLFVVADFNFDNKEDFAIIQDVGGNGGPLYRFYIQNNSGQYLLDTFLTDSVGYFPAKFDEQNHRLIVSVRSSAVSVTECEYVLKDSKWTLDKVRKYGLNFER